jgi:hypothetical protein
MDEVELRVPRSSLLPFEAAFYWGWVHFCSHAVKVLIILEFRPDLWVDVVSRKTSNVVPGFE